MAALALAALVAVGPMSVARADGDPASDFLLTNQVFVTSTSGSLSPYQRHLLSTVEAVNRAGFNIRVAVIANANDLGSVTELWRNPRVYAHFLGEELSLAYKGRLLVAMPDGFGFNWPGHSAAADYRLLSTVPVEPGGGELAVAARAAVRRLAAEAHLAPAPVRRQPARATSASDVWILAVVTGILAVLSALVLVLWRRRPPALRRPLPRAALLGPVGLVVVCGAAAGAVVIATAGRVRTRKSSLVAVSSAAPSPKQAASVVTPPPFSWSAGQRRAPNFSLFDQAGGRLSLNSYRGHPVIITFIDPVCRSLCPLEAKVLNQVVRRMPASQRPEILAVSVDVYADTRADLHHDFHEWELVPQWRWAIGSRAQLAAVWKLYRIAVAVSRVRVEGRTITSISHTSAAYIVDRTGHERALFLWPFYPQDVVHVLRQIAS